MSDVVLKVENLSKLYRLGEVGTGTISHDLNRWWARLRGKEDPFSQVGEVNDRTSAANSKDGYVWSLKDIDFEVKRGDVLGVIGKNGAGKSTLLKLISQITAPTTGSIKAKGRIASLLEVGTGMHPEMTGRENIYLNGTILGMRKWEIDRKFDEIVDFAGCAKYVDTPVKRYSSGMKVRLGFAVAAFLEPEILIVDEVLAVGDAEFQKKAIGKMKDVSQSDGRTVLFVSHNLSSMKSLCNSGLLLSNGVLDYSGDINDTVVKYMNSSLDKVNNLTHVVFPKNDNVFSIEEVSLLKNGILAHDNLFDFKDKLGFRLIVNGTETLSDRLIAIHCFDQYEQLFSVYDINVVNDYLLDRESGRFELTVEFPAPIFKPGKYSFDFNVGWFGVGPQQAEKEALSIDVAILSTNSRFHAANLKTGKFHVEPNWTYKSL